MEIMGGIIWNCVIYKCSIRDYFTLGFPFLNRAGKKTFVTAKECMKFYNLKNDKMQAAILDNKEELLHYLNKYVSREWCGQSYNASEQIYQLFTEKHSKCIVKPLEGSGGHGIEIVNCNEMEENLFEYCKQKNAIAEELIEQHPDIAKIYKYSVNTVRIFTLNKKTLGAVIRFGTGGSTIDNASSGGIFAPIDILTGVVSQGAYSFSIQETVIRHPDTQYPIPGICIPYWKECVHMVEEASELLDKLPLVGWDVAITKKGPVLVEANCEPEIPLLQIPSKYGIRNLLEI